MLTTLLQNLQGFVSRGFTVAFFVPSLAFSFCNGAMLYWSSGPFRRWAQDLLANGAGWRSLWAGATCLIAIAVLAYALSALSGRLRALLEGKWFGARLFLRGQFEARDRLVRECKSILSIRADLERSSSDDPQANRRGWSTRLREARVTGAKDQKGNNSFPFDREFRKDETTKEILALRSQRRSGGILLPEDIEKAVTKLEAVLRKNDAGAVYTKKNGKKLGTTVDDAQTELGNLIVYAVEFARDEHARLVTKFQFDFGGQPTISGHPAAPTSMGNVAATVHAYAETRYNLNLDIFWSRLQRSIRKDDGSYAAIQDSKTLLDFLIVSSWLTGAFGVLWTLALLVAGYDWVVFVGVGLGWPIAAYAWYRVAVEQYRAFADLLRAAVDIFRFNLLADLRIAPPADLDDERYLWDELNRTTALGDTDPVFRYQHPKSPS
jgi:hypothetical protein